MAELIDKGALAELFEEKMFNSEVMCPVIKITDVLEIIEDLPTVTEAEIRAKAIEEFKEKAMRKLTELELKNVCYTVTDCKIILREIAEQLKGE